MANYCTLISWIHRLGVARVLKVDESKDQKTRHKFPLGPNGKSGQRWLSLHLNEESSRKSSKFLKISNIHPRRLETHIPPRFARKSQKTKIRTYMRGHPELENGELKKQRRKGRTMANLLYLNFHGSARICVVRVVTESWNQREGAVGDGAPVIRQSVDRDAAWHVSRLQARPGVAQTWRAGGSRVAVALHHQRMPPRGQDAYQQRHDMV